MRQLSLFNKEQGEHTSCLYIDNQERARLKKRGLNCQKQMIAANWPCGVRLLVGFLEAQTDKHSDELLLLRRELISIAIEIIDNG